MSGHEDGLVPVFVTSGVRTSDGPGPGVRRVPAAEASRIVASRHGVMGDQPPRGFEDGGAPASSAAMIPRTAR